MDSFARKTATGDIPYWIALGVYLFFAVLQTSFYRKYVPQGNLMNVILLLLMLLLVFREIRFGSFDSAAGLLLFSAAVFAVNALMGSTLFMAFPFFLIFCGRDVPPGKLFLFTSCCTFALLLLVCGGALSGVITNYQRIEANRESNRAYLGFLYALYAGTLFFNGCALLLTVRGRRIRPLTLALLFAGGLWIYRETDGRFSFLMTAALIAFHVAAMLYPSVMRHAGKAFAAVIPLFPLCAVGSVVLTLRFNAAVRWMYRLDNALNHRLTYGLQSIEKFGIHLTGHPVKWIGYGLNADGYALTGDYLYVDNMYLNFLQRFGWIAFVLAVVLVTAALIRLYRAGRNELLFIFFLITLHGLFDDLSLQLAYNTFWIAAAHALTAGGCRKEAWDYESVC